MDVIRVDNRDFTVKAKQLRRSGFVPGSVFCGPLTITIDVDGMPVGTVLTVGDIPELVSDKIELQVATDEIVLRIIDRKRTASNMEQESAEG